jgi:hypothetical protein
MFKITSITPWAYTTHADGFETVGDAQAWIATRYGRIVACDEDTDHPGHYDLFVCRGSSTINGQIFAIEPMKRVSADWLEVTA